MATTPTKPGIEIDATLTASRAPSWPDRGGFAPAQGAHFDGAFHRANSDATRELPSGRDALQALLAFSALHQQIRQRRALAARHKGFETIAPATEFEAAEQFVLDEVLQLVAERAIAITGADGLGIALAENNEIVLRASAGAIKPDVGQRIERDSAFSGASFRKAQIIRCDDTETDDRVNLYACRQLRARSMVAVPLCGRRRVIGLLEAFSAEPFGFNDSDVNSLGLLAELIVAALKPEDEERFAESAQVAEADLMAPVITMQTALPFEEADFEQTDFARIGSETISAAAAEMSLTKGSTEAESAESATAVIAPDLVAPDLVAPAIIASAIKETSSLPPPSTELQTELEPATENAIVPETITLDPEPSSGHHPGIVLVLVLVVISVLLAGGLWWKLKNAQLSKVMVQPEPKITKPVTKQQAPLATTSSVVPSSVTPSSIVPSSITASSITPPSVNLSSLNSSSTSLDEQARTAADAGSENVTPQQRSKLPRVTGIRHWSSDESSTVVLDLEDQVQYEAHRLASPDRIYFDLHDTSLAAAIDGKTVDVSDSLLARVRLSQPISGVTRVVLETKGKPEFSVSLEPNPYRLVVQVWKLGTNPKAQVNLFPGAAPVEAQKLAIVVPAPSREDLQLRARVPKMRIVVDAGHGGWDLGTVGKRGLLEKDVVLEIAQRLGMLLESRLGADVILTRNDDNYIPLDERAGRANQSQADLFISVHANYSDLPSARGVETYYTNFFSAPNAKDKDFESRDPDHASNTHSAVLSAAELHEKIEQSRRLAASVQRSLYGTLSVQNPGLRDRGVKEASYVVLTETAMPGILAEVSFVSSPADEQKLRSDGYREQIAEALYKGIARYAANSRGVKVASAGK